MKKLTFISLLGLLLLSSTLLWAQDDENKTKMFVKTVPIVRIYQHELGYKIIYYKVGLDAGEFYIPYSWFNMAGGKANIVWGNDIAYPFFSIYWDDGKFDHINFFLMENTDHSSWGYSRASFKDWEENFNVTPETFVIDF